MGLKTEARTNCLIIVQIKYAESEGLCGTSPKENCQFKFLEIVSLHCLKENLDTNICKRPHILSRLAFSIGIII